MASNGTIAIGELYDLDLHFRSKIFSFYVFITKMRRQRMSPADLLRLARPPPWSCSCLSFHLFSRTLSKTIYTHPHKHASPDDDVHFNSSIPRAVLDIYRNVRKVGK